MILPFSHPWLLVPTALVVLICLGLTLRAHLRTGLGVQVVGQRPLWLGLGAALMLAGVGLGLAAPRWGDPEAPRLTVLVTLDASRSMTVQDAGASSRWDAAVAALDRLWSRPLAGLSFSLDLLTGDAIPILPPGEDRILLRETLRAVRPGEVGSPGTSLGRGLLQVAAQATPGAPTVILLLSDGEETWEAPEEALARAEAALRQAGIPLCIIPFGDGRPHEVPSQIRPKATPEATTSTAHPEFLARLAQATGGQVFKDAEAAVEGLQALASGKAPLPRQRSIQPAHPEAGAWLALLGLALWLACSGKPIAKWRPILLILAGLVAPTLTAQAPGGSWAPPAVKAWLAQRALEAGDLEGAQQWRPGDARPSHLLLAAQIDLRAGLPEVALGTLSPLVGQGSPRPTPPWRVPALLLAARAHLAAQRPEEARALLERLLLETPGQREAIHNLQTLVRDTVAPPPPDPRQPPPPPRPSLGARQDELEGLRLRLPRPTKPPGGMKDL